MFNSLLTFLIFQSKDFTPGYVKRTKYCCSKCEMRMTGHESLHMETECPFFAYQRQSRMYMTPCGDDNDSSTHLYDFISDHQTIKPNTRYDRICQRYDAVYDRRCVSQLLGENEVGLYEAKFQRTRSDRSVDSEGGVQYNDVPVKGNTFINDDEKPSEFL